jgi:hypothetical protein
LIGSRSRLTWREREPINQALETASWRFAPHSGAQKSMLKRI